MGALEIGSGKERTPKPMARTQRRRLGVRIDMTPMVDVAFLLLIFFMVTTVFRTPQALEVGLPPKNRVRPVGQQHILFLRVLPGDRMFWNMANGAGKPASVTLAQLPALIRSHHAADADLVVVIKIDRNADFHNMVDIIDDLDLARMTRFSMAPMTDEEKEEIEAM